MSCAIELVRTTVRFASGACAQVGTASVDLKVVMIAVADAGNGELVAMIHLLAYHHARQLTGEKSRG